MYFANQESARKYDKFKEEYLKKKQSPSSKYKFKPIFLSNLIRSPFIRKSIIIISLSSSLYFCYRFNQQYFTMDYLITNNYFNYFQLQSLHILWKDFSLRFSRFFRDTRGYKESHNIRFANQLYFMQLEEDYQKMVFTANPRVIKTHKKSKWGLGYFRIQSEEESMKINRSGDVIKQTKKSMLNLGEISLVGRKKTQIIEENKYYQIYKQEIKRMKDEEKDFNEKHCSTINLINIMNLNKQESDQLLEECRIKSSLKLRKIINTCEKTSQENEKKKQMSFFFIA